MQKYVKNVFLHNYMDDHSFDAAVLRKCTSMQVIPDGRMIPFCAYNSVGYREQVVGALMADARLQHSAI